MPPQHYRPAHVHKPEQTRGLVSPGLAPSSQGAKWQKVNLCGGCCCTAQLDHHKLDSPGMASGCCSVRRAHSLHSHPYPWLSQGTGALWQACQSLSAARTDEPSTPSAIQLRAPGSCADVHTGQEHLHARWKCRRLACRVAGCGGSHTTTLPAWGTTSDTWNCLISCGRPPKPPSSTSYLDAKRWEIWKRAPPTCPRFPNFPIRMRHCPPAPAQAISRALRFSERAGSSHPAAPQRLTETDGRPAQRRQARDGPPPLGDEQQTDGGGMPDGPRAGAGAGWEETAPARVAPRFTAPPARFGALLMRTRGGRHRSAPGKRGGWGREGGRRACAVGRDCCV